MWPVIIYALIGCGFTVYEVYWQCCETVREIIKRGQEITTENFNKHLAMNLEWHVVWLIILWPLMAFMLGSEQFDKLKAWAKDRLLVKLMHVAEKRVRKANDKSGKTIQLSATKTVTKPIVNIPSVVAPPMEQLPNWPLSEQAKQAIEGAYQHVKPQEANNK